jgi:hypothetical protein
VPYVEDRAEGAHGAVLKCFSLHRSAIRAMSEDVTTALPSPKNAAAIISIAKLVNSGTAPDDMAQINKPIEIREVLPYLSDILPMIGLERMVVTACTPHKIPA